jgi:hypothetical chaperone protein
MRWACHKFSDIIAGYLRHLKRLAEARAGGPISRLVLGRPVFFVDGEPERDAQAQSALESAARQVGFRDVLFQYEPIAAALDHEQRIAAEQLVLVADIGGGTSDFSLVRVGPAPAADRREDILANHGVHVAGTDFDRHVELSAILPLLGYRSLRPARPGEAAREVPSGIYFDRATGHLINTVYAPAHDRSTPDAAGSPRDAPPAIDGADAAPGPCAGRRRQQAKIDLATDGRALIA